MFDTVLYLLNFILEFVLSKPNIVVLDAIMGNSKTQRLKSIMLDCANPVLYITPLLSESMSVVGVVNDGGVQLKSDDGEYLYDTENPLHTKRFKIPNIRNKNHSKLESLEFMVDNGFNISSTHKLFSMLTPQIATKFLSMNYTLVVDESMNCWNNLNIYDFFEGKEDKALSENEKSDQKNSKGSRTDKEVIGLINAGSIHVDPIGLLHWDTESQYVPTSGMLHYELKLLCDMKQLYLSNGKVVFWELTAELMKSFNSIYIGTYMFEYSVMSHYMDVHGLEYEVVKFGNSPMFYKKYIDIVQGKINDVGDGKFALSYSKLEGKTKVKDSVKETRQILKRNLDNFFKNRCKTSKEYNLWTTYIDSKSSVINSRCNVNCVPYNIKATNDYRHCTSVAYLVNNFPNTFLVSMITKRNNKRKFDQDMWALSEMLQMLFRSAIRGDKYKGDESRHIKLYIPSQRMRNLLESWLNGEFEEK